MNEADYFCTALGGTVSRTTRNMIEDMILNSQQAIETAGSNTVLVVVDVNKPSITECPELLALLQIRRSTGPPQAGYGDH